MLCTLRVLKPVGEMTSSSSNWQQHQQQLAAAEAAASAPASDLHFANGALRVMEFFFKRIVEHKRVRLLNSIEAQPH